MGEIYGGRVKSLAILIPAYRPSSLLIDLLKELYRGGESSELKTVCIVVDDGGGEDFAAVFAEAAAIPGVTVIRHAVNLGKGAALKSGFNYILTQRPEIEGVITADADGQHRPADIFRVARELVQTGGESLVLGSRAFAGDVPLRSRFGNKVTRGVFRLFTGLRLTDTQTGLRGISPLCMKHFLRIPLNGYDYELECLLLANAKHIPIRQVEIQTVYIDGNASSHFSPIRDSMRIYFVFLRYCGSSLVTASVDYLVFFIALGLDSSVGFAQAAARATAALIAFTLARNIVFRAQDVDRVRSLLKFGGLVVLSGFLSYGLMELLIHRAGISAGPAKLLAEASLYFGNFAIQREFIFRRAAPNRQAA
jgi:glycosyltransferase involved in cell wall biosynthesis